MRCACCNRILSRVTGYRTLPDGTKVQEDFCNTCKNEVTKTLRDTDDYDQRNYRLEGIVEQVLFYGATTPSKNPPY